MLLFWILHLEHHWLLTSTCTAPVAVSICSSTGEFFPRAQILTHRKHLISYMITAGVRECPSILTVCLNGFGSQGPVTYEGQQIQFSVSLLFFLLTSCDEELPFEAYRDIYSFLWESDFGCCQRCPHSCSYVSDSSPFHTGWLSG